MPGGISLQQVHKNGAGRQTPCIALPPPFNMQNPETPPIPLTREEIASVREKARAGNLPTLETLRRFIASTRKSWLAKPVEKTQGKSRVKKEPPSEKEIDFF